MYEFSLAVNLSTSNKGDLEVPRWHWSEDGIETLNPPKLSRPQNAAYVDCFEILRPTV